jgi:hypothetical protein
MSFLSDDDLRHLTGRAQKSRQVEWLRAQGIPFHVNATGHPVVTWAAVEGRQQSAENPQETRAWSPRVIAGGV